LAKPSPQFPQAVYTVVHLTPDPEAVTAPACASVLASPSCAAGSGLKFGQVKAKPRMVLICI